MSSQTPPLWKQLLGAVVGGSLALVLYNAYTFIEPRLQGVLVLPQARIKTEHALDARRLAARDIPADRAARMTQRAREIAENLAEHSAAVAPSDGTQYDAKKQDPVKRPKKAVTKRATVSVEDAVEREELHPAVERTGISEYVPVFYDTNDAPVSYAQQLPDSGVGLGSVALMSILGAGGAVWRKRRR